VSTTVQQGQRGEGTIFFLLNRHGKVGAWDMTRLEWMSEIIFEEEDVSQTILKVAQSTSHQFHFFSKFELD